MRLMNGIFRDVALTNIGLAGEAESIELDYP